MAFGVKVTPNIDAAEVNAEELRKAIQSALNEETAKNPIAVRDFEASISKKRTNSMRSKIQNAMDTATAEKPIQIKNFSANLSTKDSVAMLKKVRESMEAIGVTLRIKEINATSAVNKLRKQLTTMLGGLSITGLKEFVGDEGMSEAMERASKKAAAAAEKQAAALEKGKQAAKGLTAEMQQLSNLRQVTNSVSRKTLSIGDSDNGAEKRADLQGRATQILKDIEIASKKTGDEQRAMIDSISLAVQKLKEQADAQIAIQRETAKTNKAYEAAGGEEAYNAAKAKKEAAEKESASKREASALSRVIRLRSQMQTWVQNNSKAYKLNKDAIDAMLSELQNEGAITSKRLEEMRQGFMRIEETSSAAGNTGKSFFEKLSAGWEKYGGWSLVTKSMMTVWNAMKDMVRAAIELDSAMTELRKVTDLSEASYAKFRNTVSSTATEIGASVADTINSVADFSRLGFDIEGAQALAKAALVYKNVGDGISDISVSSESLISTIKAFQDIDPENAMSVVDKFNEVGRFCPAA